MHELDDTDLDVLQLLAEDARRPYSEIADRVGVSPPTVSDRVDRLEELGIIERFTLDIDRSKLEDGVDLLLEVETKPGHAETISDQFSELAVVQHVFTTVDDAVVLQATVPKDDIRAELLDPVDEDAVTDWTARLLSDVEWTPQVSGTEFALECDECGNTVTNQGESARIDGTLYHFCCDSCLTSFENEYEALAGESV